jgi:ABC-type xylose transport system permease subunit
MRETFIKAKQFSVDRLRVELLPAQALQDLLSKHHECPAVDMRRALYCHAPEKGSAIFIFIFMLHICIFVFVAARLRSARRVFAHMCSRRCPSLPH